MGTSVEFASLQRKPGGKANLNWIRDLLRPGISSSWRIAAMGSAPVFRFSSEKLPRKGAALDLPGGTSSPWTPTLAFAR